MNAKLFLTIAIITCSLKLLTAQTKAEMLTNSNIIKLFKAGLDNDIILSKIESTACKFDLSGEALVNLKSAGLDGNVIKAMMNKMEARKTVSSAPLPALPAKKNIPPVNNLPEPEMINAVYVYDKPVQAVKALERNTAALKSQSKMLGYGGTNLIYQIAGEKSTVRFTPDDTKSFIVNTASGPADIFVLYKVEVKKNTRQAIGAKYTLTGMKGSQGVIAIDLKLLKTGLYELIPSTKLEKGEYFFTIKTANNSTTTNADVYAFGIDE